MEWSQVRALAADGVSQRQLAAWLGSTGGRSKRLSTRSDRRAMRGRPAGRRSIGLNRDLGFARRWPETGPSGPRRFCVDDYGDTVSVDFVRKQMAELRPRSERPAPAHGLPAWAVRERRFVALTTRSSASCA